MKLTSSRSTPIGALHRVIWLHIPGAMRSIDQSLTQGRLSAWMAKAAHTLWNDRHPLVMVRRLLLLLRLLSFDCHVFDLSLLLLLGLWTSCLVSLHSSFEYRQRGSNSLPLHRSYI